MWLGFTPARLPRQPWCSEAAERRVSAGESDRMRPPTGRSSFCLAGITTTLRCHLREENVRHDEHSDKDYQLSIKHLFAFPLESKKKTSKLSSEHVDLEYFNYIFGHMYSS